MCFPAWAGQVSLEGSLTQGTRSDESVTRTGAAVCHDNFCLEGERYFGDVETTAFSVYGRFPFSWQPLGLVPFAMAGVNYFDGDVYVPGQGLVVGEVDSLDRSRFTLRAGLGVRIKLLDLSYVADVGTEGQRVDATLNGWRMTLRLPLGN